MPFNALKDYPVVKCIEDEKIHCVQRKHPIFLLGHILLLCITVLIIPVSLFTISFSFPSFYVLITSPVLVVYTILTTISVFWVVFLYLYFSWYYHFYVITSKALIDRYSFRLGGEYSEVVYGDKMHVQEIVRKPRNLFYDLLKIHDVYIYFHKLEKEEPFIFRGPQDSQEIEDLIEDLRVKT